MFGVERLIPSALFLPKIMACVSIHIYIYAQMIYNIHVCNIRQYIHIYIYIHTCTMTYAYVQHASFTWGEFSQAGNNPKCRRQLHRESPKSKVQV